jgi:DNA-binding NtrC family response regulator
LSIPGLAGLKILLVEGDQFIQDALKTCFLAEGCSLTAVNSATEGLSLLEKNSFDVIICDFELSGVDGFEFFKLASGYSTKSIKIMIAGYGDIDPMSKVFHYGIKDIIEKPFSFESLLFTIAKHLKNAPADR